MAIDTVVVHEYFVPWSFQIVELPAADRPYQGTGDQRDDHQGNCDQQINDFHGQPLILRALATTRMELKDMPIAAIHGVT